MNRQPRILTRKVAKGNEVSTISVKPLETAYRKPPPKKLPTETINNSFMWKQCEASAGRRTVCGRRCRCKITQKTAPVNATLLSFLPACAQAASPAASPLAAPVLHQILRKDCDLPLPPSSDRAPFYSPCSPAPPADIRQCARLCLPRRTSAAVSAIRDSARGLQYQGYAGRDL